MRSAAAAVCLALLATACPSSREPPAPGAFSPEPSPTAPPSGEIRIAYPADPPTLNPFLRSGDAPAVRELIRPLLPPLFMTGPGGERAPWLAERVLSESPREVRLSLRGGAVWSDGRPITSSDVRFTWQTIMDDRWPIASREGYDRIADVDIVSPSELRMTFTQDFPRWRDLFSAGLGVLPQHLLEGKDFAAALTSGWEFSGGPFVLERYTRGLEIVLVASPNPWPAPPRLERIRVLFVPDSTTAVQMYRAGRVDAIGPYASPDFARRLGEEDGLSITRDAGTRWTGLALNTRAGVLTDERVRRAAALTVDADDLADGLVRGEGERLRRPFVTPEGAQASIPGVDRAAAARLLDEAGFSARSGGARRRGSTDLAFSLVSDGWDDLAQRVGRGLFFQLEDAGFDVNMVTLEYEELWRDWLPSNRFEAALVTFADPPDGALRARYHSSQVYPSGVNYARIGNPDLDAAIEGSDAGAGADTAAEALARFVPVIPLYRITAVAAAREGVSGIRANGSADGLFATAHEWSLA